MVTPAGIATLQGKARRWGRSIAVVIPQETVRQLKLHSGDELVIELRKKDHPLRELFGSLHFTAPGEEIVREVRQELTSKWEG